ncbi:sensor histidine kinase [Chloroflexota bacterium]
MNARLSSLLIYILGVLAMLLLTVVLIQVLMNPPLGDLIYLAVLLGITSLISAAFGFISHRLGWWRRLPHISQTLILGYILAGGLALLNIWLTAKLMFINQHDLILGTLLLIFAGGVSIAFGYFISNSITQDLQDLVQGAEKISQGDFATRVAISGEDEVAQLALAFNQMATQLEKAAEAERTLDEARRNLVAWASHDLRTPLASLMVMLDALVDGIISEPNTVTRYLEQSQNEVNRMSALIDDLFELAQLDAGYQDLDFEWIALSDLISDTLESFAAQATNQGVTLEGAITPEVDPILAAPDKLSRILDNLVGNALRFTPKGGSIFLEACLIGAQVQVEVRDTGNGIAAKDLPHIFDRFYRGEKSRARGNGNKGGVGLGLAIVKSLIKAHGGDIVVESEPDIGTTFKFTLPKGKTEKP